MEFSFPIDQIPTTGKDVAEELTREWVQFALGDLLRPGADAAGIEFQLNRRDKNVTLDGELTLTYEFDCSRCADPVPGDVKVPLHLAFVEGDEDSDDLTLDGWGLDSRREVVFYRGTVVNTEDPIIEQIVFVLPSIPLCSDRCRGVCVQCGANLNRSSCDCTEVFFEPDKSRFADLKLGG